MRHIASRLLGLLRRYDVAENPYGTYCVPKSVRHRPAAAAVLGGDVYEATTIDFIRTNCGSGDVVHAGAFFGDFLPPLARALVPGARLWSFEPNPENFRAALTTVKINRLTNVRLMNAGLGRAVGRAQVRVRDAEGRSLGGLSAIVEEDGSGIVPVRVVTLDDVIPRESTISVLHLDVEGFETPALEGALETIRRCRPVLVLESVPDGAWLDEHLHPLGYRLEGRIDTNTVLIAKLPAAL